MARTGAPEQELPSHFGPWNTVYQRCNLWAQSEVLSTACHKLRQTRHLGVLLVEGTCVTVHPQGTGAPKRTPPDPAPGEEALGCSQGGLTTLMMAWTDPAGRLVKFTRKPGNAAESSEHASLLSDVPLTQTQDLWGDKD